MSAVPLEERESAVFNHPLPEAGFRRAELSPEAQARVDTLLQAQQIIDSLSMAAAYVQETHVRAAQSSFTPNEHIGPAPIASAEEPSVEVADPSITAAQAATSMDTLREQFALGA